jgi:two-component system response regulator
MWIYDVVFTASSEDRDIIESYRYGANSYIREPVYFEHIVDAFRQLSSYWLFLSEAAPAQY